WFDNAQEAGASGRQARDRTRLQTRALDELELPHNATGEQVREKYGILIKRFHPDSNGGDRSMEGKLNLVIRAYKALKSAGLA
ncbi:MAG: DnaJ domain-containing protein, partial [Alphaproteobacteria bacterium]